MTATPLRLVHTVPWQRPPITQIPEGAARRLVRLRMLRRISIAAAYHDLAVHGHPAGRTSDISLRLAESVIHTWHPTWTLDRVDAVARDAMTAARIALTAPTDEKRTEAYAVFDEVRGACRRRRDGRCGVKRLHYRTDVRDATVHIQTPHGVGQAPLTAVTFRDSTGAPYHVTGFEDEGRTVVLDLGPAVAAETAGAA